MELIILAQHKKVHNVLFFAWEVRLQPYINQYWNVHNHEFIDTKNETKSKAFNKINILYFKHTQKYTSL